jgi:predicted amidophosphoribosyltransferase
MSTNNTVLLHDVNIPALNSVGYADGLHSALTSIESNESLLANRDFVKGDRGDSVDIEKIDLNEYPDLFDLLKSTIKGGLDPQPIGGVSWDSLLGTDLYVINKTEIENGVERYVPISSLYYTFVDGRFVNDNVGNLSAEDFADESDLSCILVYEDGEFKKLSNIFPNMYFEDGHGLCWMVNGQRTGLPVQGVPGKDGRNSDILIVKVKENIVDENGKGEVEESWNKLGNWTTIEDKESMDGYSCFALAPTEEGSTAFYAGKLTFDEGVLYVICKPELSLQQTFDTQTFINVMQNISIKPNPDMIATPPGLFVPMKTLGDLTKDEAGNVIENQPVHIMTATSINNEVGNEQDLMIDMVVTPVNTTAVTIDTDHDVKVDKYLYVRMNDEVRPLVEAKMNVRDGMFTNYKLKFKLSNILLTPNVQRPITENEKVYFLTETAIDENGVMDFNELAPYDKWNKMIPTDFRENINKGIGIYVWSLDLSQDSFDPDNTLYAHETSPLRDIFPVVYTKTMTPGIGDDILWFNSLIVDEENFFGVFTEFVEGIEGEVAGGDSTEEPTPATFMMRAAVRPSMPEVDGDIAHDKETEMDDSTTTGGDNTTTDGDREIGNLTPILPGPNGTVECPVCGFVQDSSITTCGNCGEDFNSPSLTILVCPECGENNPNNRLECWGCGTQLIQRTKVCPQCKSTVKANTIQCPTCGYQFFDIPPITEITEICPGCGTENTFYSTQYSKVCSHCQYDFDAPGEKVCPNCDHHTTDLESTHCENCNYNFYTHEIDEVNINAYIGKVTGYITENGEPLIGATVKIPGARFGTQTDNNGYYSLPVTEGEFNTSSLEIAYIGYDTITILIQRRNRIDVEVTDVPEPERPSINPDYVYKLLRGTDRVSLIFDKFVPIYVNSYRMDRDTSYNLNYNVNITGDEINPKRTLSVYGDINCENINVYELTATGEIKNIYTKNEIVGEEGIDLAKGKFHVDSNGNVNAQMMDTDNLSTNDIKTGALTTGTLRITQTDVDGDGVISETDNLKIATIDDEHNVDIDINKVSDITIRGKADNPSKVDSDIPIVLDWESGLHISNKKNLIGYKGNTVSGMSGYNGSLDQKVKYYANQCMDTTKKNAIIKRTVFNSNSNYCGARQTSLSGMQSALGSTYIQVCNPSGYVKNYTFDGNSDYGSKKPITVTTDITKSSLSAIQTQACCSFVIGDELIASTANTFNLKFHKPFVFAVSMNTSCSNGKWAVLKTGSSKVVFKVVVVGDDVSGPPQIWDVKTIECGFGDGDFGWSGYEQASKSGNDRWREYVRTRIFVVRPNDITFDGNFAGYKNLKVYVVPIVNMRFESEGNYKYLVDYMGCTQFLPKSDYTVSKRDTVYVRPYDANPDNVIFTKSSITEVQKQYTSLTYEYNDGSD